MDTDTGVFGVADTYLGNVFNPLSLNRYLYCLSDPVNYVDPTGHAVRTLAIFNEIRRAKTILPQYRSKSQPGMSPNAFSSTQLRVTTHLVAPGKPESAKYSNLNYTMNTWYAMQAERAGDAEAAARYYQLANQYHQWYLQHYCGAEKKPMGELPSQMHDWASAYWYIPAVSSIVEMCAYTAEGNAPMTALYSAMSLVEVLTLGTSAEMLAPIKGATKAPVGIEELIKGITRLPGAASSALKGVMKLPSLAASALRESIADGAKALERLASSVTGRQLASEGADAGASVTGGYTKYEAKAIGGSSGAGSTSGKGAASSEVGSSVLKESAGDAADLGELIYASNKNTVRRLSSSGIVINGQRITTADEAAELVFESRRKASALTKNDESHVAPTFLSIDELKEGEVYSITGTDGQTKIFYQVSGVLHDKKGIYEYIVDIDGRVSHQFFKEGGIVNGRYMHE